MIGCYIHHQGTGHLHRSLAWAQTWATEHQEPVTGLSTLAAPQGWPGPWVSLEADDDDAPTDTNAGGVLHWAPLQHTGLRRRMQRISHWIADQAPELLVVDISVEVGLLARLHGVPVVTVALPGDRTDRTHALGYEISSAVVGFWPESAQTQRIIERADQGPATSTVGAISRFPNTTSDLTAQHTAQQTAQQTASDAPLDSPQILIMSGAGGGGLSASAQEALKLACPEAQITSIGGADGRWVSDPWDALNEADLVITAAGQNSIAEVAASGTPAIVHALERHHQEQQHTLRTLVAGPWPAVAAPWTDEPRAWGTAVRHALQLNGTDWASWCDGRAAARFTDLLQQLRDIHR